MKKTRYTLIICTLILMAPALLVGQNIPIGEYKTVSESEWTIRLLFKPEGELTIYLEAWSPGEYEKREIKTIQGTWRVKGEYVVVEYDGTIERLRLVEHLSLESIGGTGALPGLEGSCEDNKGTLQGYPFWEVKSLQERYP